MRTQVAVAVFLFLSVCSMASMRLSPTPETKPVAFDGGGFADAVHSAHYLRCL